MSSRVAVRYAKALVEALEEKKDLDAVQHFFSFCKIVAGHEELRRLLANVTVSAQDKARVIRALGDKLTLPATIVKFLETLAHNGRLPLLAGLEQTVARILDQKQKMQTVTLTTAVPLSEAQLASFSRSMERVLNSKVRVAPRVAEDILGGAIAQVGSFVYDGSVSGRLQRLRRDLVKENQ